MTWTFVTLDELLWHFNWTGDLGICPPHVAVPDLHLAWENATSIPDNDGFTMPTPAFGQAMRCIITVAPLRTALPINYRGNKLAALIAEKIGEDPTPIGKRPIRYWKRSTPVSGCRKGHWAEFQDFMGHRRLHEDAAVWTIYHALDSDVADPFQAYLATSYMNRDPHIPVVTSGWCACRRNVCLSMQARSLAGTVEGSGCCRQCRKVCHCGHYRLDAVFLEH